MNDFVTKPIHPKELIEKLSRWIKTDPTQDSLSGLNDSIVNRNF